jgi:hypothetical protein
MMARMLVCCACLCELATIGRRCENCAPVQERAAASKGKRRPDPAELLALAETDPEAALAALEALQRSS